MKARLLIAAVRQHIHHAFVVRRRNQHVDVQVALPLIRLLRQYVTGMRVASFDLAALRPPKALGGALVCSSFWHSSPYDIADFRLPIADLFLPTKFNWQSASGSWQSKLMCRRRLLPAALVSLRSEDDEHLVPFHLRPCLDLTDVRQIVFEPLENARAQLTVRHLASAKPDRGLYFVALLQPLARMFHAVVVVVVVSAGSKLNFLNRNRDLLLLGLVSLLLRFVLVFSEVDNPANGRIGGGSNFDKVQACFPA